MTARPGCRFRKRRLSAGTAPRIALRADLPPPSPPDNQVHALQALVARLEGELGGVREALGEARARADAAEARSAELSADLAAERATTAKAIAAYAALAEPLEALAARRAKPWWRRLAG